MRVVLDTNVIVSALLSPRGTPAKIMHNWEESQFEILTSPALITELERVLHYPRLEKHLMLSNNDITTFLKRLQATALMVEPQITLDVIEKDPDDNRVVECAVAGRAAYIVSGNDHLLELGEYQQIVILKPVGFLMMLRLMDEQPAK